MRAPAAGLNPVSTLNREERDMGQMYGKPRIILSRAGKIVRAGGKGYHEIGKWERTIGGHYRVVVLTPERKWDRNLVPDENAKLYHFNTRAEARERVALMWSDGMGGLQ